MSPVVEFSETGGPEVLRFKNVDIPFVINGLEKGTLKPVIDRVFPFDQIVEAHRYLEASEQIGKIVVTI
jgi:NADPH:quinone reductase-like Zn-dependent oxidoreductase